MSHWQLARLGDVVEFLDHRRKPVTASDRVNGPYPYYGANGQQGTIDAYIFNEPLLLLAEDGGHFDDPSRGIAYKISGPSWVNNHAHVLRMTSALDLGFAHRILANMDVRRYVTGTTRAKLTKTGAANIEIPLPPLDEQRRIAAILDQADALSVKRRQVNQRTDELVRAIFNAMFGNLPAEHKLADGCIRITDGTHQSPQWSSSGVPFLFISNITSGQIDFNTSKYISIETWRDLTRSTPIEVGDVLYSTVGVTYGIPAIVRSTQRFAFQRHIAHLKPRPDVLLPEFLAAMLASPLVKRQADRAARGAAQPTVNLADIKKFDVILPPLEEQKAFAARMESVRSMRSTAAAGTEEHRRLFISLQSRVFSGQL